MYWRKTSRSIVTSVVRQERRQIEGVQKLVNCWRCGKYFNLCANNWCVSLWKVLKQADRFEMIALNGLRSLLIVWLISTEIFMHFNALGKRLTTFNIPLNTSYRIDWCKDIFQFYSRTLSRENSSTSPPPACLLQVYKYVVGQKYLDIGTMQWQFKIRTTFGQMSARRRSATSLE